MPIAGVNATHISGGRVFPIVNKPGTGPNIREGSDGSQEDNINGHQSQYIEHQLPVPQYLVEGRGREGRGGEGRGGEGRGGEGRGGEGRGGEKGLSKVNGMKTCFSLSHPVPSTSLLIITQHMQWGTYYRR